jgi:hypothetical protein
MPYLGINRAFKITFKKAVVSIIYWNTLCLPVILRRMPTEPEIELINWPIVRIMRASTPALNSSPKIPSMNDGEKTMASNIGKEVQKISLVDF